MVLKLSNVLDEHIATLDCLVPGGVDRGRRGLGWGWSRRHQCFESAAQLRGELGTRFDLKVADSSIQFHTFLQAQQSGEALG